MSFQPVGGLAAKMLPPDQPKNTTGPDASKTGAAVDKWQILRFIESLRNELVLRAGEVKVLETLLKLHKPRKLSYDENMVVFASNAVIAQCAGMGKSTVRKHVASLVERGLLSRKPSPNGKRYPVCNGQRKIIDAFGIDLTPLLIRADELRLRAKEVAASEARRQECRQRIKAKTCAIESLIALAMAELPGVDWQSQEDELHRLRGVTARTAAHVEAEALLSQLEALHSSLAERLDQHRLLLDLSTGPAQIEHHIQSSEKEYKESERGDDGQTDCAVRQPATNRYTSYPPALTTILKVLPDMENHAGSGLQRESVPRGIRSWGDFIDAAMKSTPFWASPSQTGTAQCNAWVCTKLRSRSATCCSAATPLNILPHISKG